MSERLRTIWKFTLETGENTLSMPECAEILTAGQQSEVVCLWALVDPNAPPTIRVFHVIPTGEVWVEEGQSEFIETVRLFGGDHVVHVFEKHEELPDGLMVKLKTTGTAKKSVVVDQILMLD